MGSELKQQLTRIAQLGLLISTMSLARTQFAKQPEQADLIHVVPSAASVSFFLLTAVNTNAVGAISAQPDKSYSARNLRSVSASVANQSIIPGNLSVSFSANEAKDKKRRKIDNFMSSLPQMRNVISQLRQIRGDPERQRDGAEQLLNSTIAVASEVLDGSSALSSYTSDEAYELVERVLKLLDAFELSGSFAASTLGPSQGYTERRKTKNVETVLTNIPLKFPAPKVILSFSAGNVSLKMDSLKVVAHASSTFVAASAAMLKGANQLLSPRKSSAKLSQLYDSAIAGKASELVMSSDIMVISLDVAKAEDWKENVTISLALRLRPALRPTCVSRGGNRSTFTSRGCTARVLDASHVQCSCNHVSSFAVLHNAVQREKEDRMKQHLSISAIVAYACFSISIFCLLLSVLTFTGLRNLKCWRTTVHANLAITMGLSQLLYLVGLGQVGNKVGCKVIAMALHYLFLCVICWMGLECLALYMKMLVLSDTTRPVKPAFICLAYAAPAIVVGVSAGIYHQGYGMATRCWLTMEGCFHLAFYGPAFSALLVSLVLLIIAFVTVCHHRKQSLSSGARKSVEEIHVWVKESFSLVILLSLTYVFWIFYLDNLSTIAFVYLFDFFNGLQGVFVFFSYCIFDDQVKWEYRQVLRRAEWLPDCCRMACFKLLPTPPVQPKRDNHEPEKPGSTTQGSILGQNWYKAETSPEGRSSSVMEGIRRTSARLLNSLSASRKHSPSPETGEKKQSFLSKEMRVKEASPAMMLDAGIYLGVEEDCGVYMGPTDSKPPSSPATVSLKKPSVAEAPTKPTEALTKPNEDAMDTEVSASEARVEVPTVEQSKSTSLFNSLLWWDDKGQRSSDIPDGQAPEWTSESHDGPTLQVNTGSPGTGRMTANTGSPGGQKLQVKSGSSGGQKLSGSTGGQRQSGSAGSPGGQRLPGSTGSPGGHRLQGSSKSPEGPRQQETGDSPTGQRLPGNSESPGGQRLPANNESPEGQRLPGNNEIPEGRRLQGNNESPGGQRPTGNNENLTDQSLPGQSESSGGQSLSGSSDSSGGQ